MTNKNIPIDVSLLKKGTVLLQRSRKFGRVLIKITEPDCMDGRGECHAIGVIVFSERGEELGFDRVGSTRYIGEDYNNRWRVLKTYFGKY